MFISEEHRERAGGILSVLAVVCLAIGGAGCATANKPNVSALYRVPAIKHQLPAPTSKGISHDGTELPAQAQDQFRKLYEMDPDLALEVGRLPEFQGKMDDARISSLGRFTEFVAAASREEKANLKELLSVGKPGSRRYCSPLQAIFWLLEDKEQPPEDNPLGHSLDTLLFKTWNFSDAERWGDFEVVTDRLNAPRLVDYYEKMQFLYIYRNRGTAVILPDPHLLFRQKIGDCVDYTAFTVYCLEKNGYKASSLNVRSPSGNPYGHFVTQFEADGQHFIMDNGRPGKRGIVPYDRYKPDM